MGLMSLPWNAPEALENLKTVVNDIWFYAGDTSVDVSPQSVSIASIYVSPQSIYMASVYVSPQSVSIASIYVSPQSIYIWLLSTTLKTYVGVKSTISITSIDVISSNSSLESSQPLSLNHTNLFP